MKKLKLFFACLLMAVLSIGQVWAALPTNPTWTATALGSISDGATVIILNNFGTAIPNADATSAGPKKVSASYNSTTKAITVSDSEKSLDDIVWTAKKTTNGVQFFVYGSTTKYLGITSSGNSNIRVNTSASYKEMVMGSAGNLMKPYDLERYIGEYVSGTDWRSYNAENANNYKSGTTLQSLTFYVLEEGEETACATPTFSPAAGAVVSGTQVSISCSTEGAAIHYTTDGTDPTASSATYISAITVSSAMTIKAIAVKDGLSDSEPATAAYTILETKTIAQIMPASTDEGAEFLLNDVTVTYAYGSNVYVKDETGYMLVYSAITGASNGKVLQGLQGKAKLYNQLPEISTVTKAPTVNDGSAVAPESLTAYPVAADLNKYVTMENVTFASATSFSGSVTNATGSFEGSDLIFRNTFKLSGVSLTAGTPYRVVGIVQKYNDNFQIYPISFEEITGETQVATPTFSPAAGTYTEVQSVTLSCETSEASIYYTTDGNVPTSASTPYTSAISVGESMTIMAIAVKDGMDDSNVASAAYTINLPADPEVTCTWDLSAESYVADPEPTADLIQWTSTYVTMKAEKNGGSTGVNNYIPPTRTSTRFYTSNKITFIPANSKQITTIVITAASSGYATALKNATWTNATAAASDTEVTITASGSGNVSCVLGANTGITAVTVNYEPYVAPTTYAVSFAAPEHGSLAIANGVTPIASGDEFVEGAELTVSAEPASGYVLDAIKVIETGSDPENDVTSTVLAGATLTVPAYAISVSATFVENVAPVATLTLSENGVEAPFAGEHHQGDVVNLPLTSSADCVKDFVGWSANASCAVAPEYAPGAEYTLASTSQTLYAVYATASGTSYVKTALANIASGSEVVITEAKTVAEETTIWAASNDKGTSAAPVAVVVTEDEGVLSSEATNIYWIITKDGDNFSFTPKGGTGKLYCTSTNNGVRVGEGENNLFSISSDYLYNNGTTRFIGVQGEADWRCYTSINSTISGQTLAFYKKTASYSDYATTCVAALADPVFTPAAGSYTEAKNIVITAEEGTIYYTTDGTDPTSSSTEYTAPIVLDENGTTTLKAIAISATSQSAIVTAAYTINMPLSTMDQIFAAATAAGSTATDANIAFGNWVVSGISTNGKNVFVTDGTKGFIIFDNGGEMGFAVGNVLSGTVACKVQLYNGAAELTTLSSTTEGLSVATGGTVTPEVKAITALSGVNTGAAVTVNSVQFDGEYLSDGTNNIKPYNSLFAYEALADGKYYNVTGIYQQFGNTKEILPRSAADIEELTLLDPELSYSPVSASLEVGQALSAPTFNNPHELAISYSTSNEAIATVSDAGVIALAGGIGTAVITASFAGNAQYAAGNATFTITVAEPVDAKNVVIIAEYDSKFYALTNSISNKTAAAVEVEKDGSNIIVTSAEAKAAIQWKKIIDGVNTTFQDADDKYLKGASNGGDLTVADAVCNWSWDDTNNCYAIGSRSFIYRESANGFKNYSIGNAGGSDYSALAEVIEIDPENIIVVVPTTHTLSYNPNGGTVIEGEDAIADAQVAEGATVTVAANVYEKDGYSFAGWLYGETVYNAGQTFPMPTTDVELVAQWTEQVVSDYVLVTDVAQLQAGDKVIIVAADYNKAAGSAAATYRNVVDIEKTSDKSHLIFGASMPTEFTLGIPAADEYTFNDGDGFMYESAAKSVKVQAESFSWSISIDAEAIATISATNELRYNHTSPRFTTYASGQDNLQLYRKPGAAPEPTYTEVRNGLTVGWYYTMCLDRAVTAVKAGSIWRVLSKAANGNDVILEEAEFPLVAGRPYIFRAAAITLEVAYTGDAVGAPVNDDDNNGLIGSFVKEEITQSSNNYIIHENALYYVNSEKVYVGANRAYLDMTGVPAYSNEPQQGAPRRRVTMAVYGKDEAQGFDNLESGDAPKKVMIDGTLYIFRGEKQYDATGRLVK